MGLMSELTKLNVFDIADRLDEPFALVNVAYVSDIVVSIYLCQGTPPWHRHIDIDELFWVYDGMMFLDSEWGVVDLYPAELTVVPKGLKHRSRSPEIAAVLLLRCGILAGRKDKRHRLYMVEQGEQSSINLYGMVDALEEPFCFHPVACVEDSALSVARGAGSWPVDFPVVHDRLFYVLEGTATLQTTSTFLHLHPGDFTVVPRRTVYRLSSSYDTSLVRLTRESG
jgi:mannose-6-phosphate isomerase-like protein (cupin superfamily)